MSDDLTPRPMQVRATQLRAQALGFNTDDGGGGPLVPPSNIDAPSVTVNGSVAASCVVGDTLTCTLGNWAGEPTDYWQTWLSDDPVMPSAGDPRGIVIGSGGTYVVQAADAGKNVQCSVTATNAAGSSNAVSNAVAVTAVGG